jgi:acyl-coenzyme A synthetase/AMP-(fatty) acid ligase
VKRTSVPKSKISNLKFYTADRSTSPPTINMPRLFNAAHDLLERNIVEGRAAKIAYIDDDGRYTYEELCARVNRSANALQKLGLKIEDRVMIVHKIRNHTYCSQYAADSRRLRIHDEG